MHLHLTSSYHWVSVPQIISKKKEKKKCPNPKGQKYWTVIIAYLQGQSPCLMQNTKTKTQGCCRTACSDPDFETQ